MALVGLLLILVGIVITASGSVRSRTIIMGPQGSGIAAPSGIALIVIGAIVHLIENGFLQNIM